MNAEPSRPERDRAFFGVLKKAEAHRLTWLGWALVLAAIAIIAAAAVFGAYPFLRAGAPVQHAPMVISGTESNLKEIVETRGTTGEPVYIVGEPIEIGRAFFAESNWGDYGANVLRTAVGPETEVIAIPVPKGGKENGCLKTARTLRKWMEAHGRVPERINVVADAAAARRVRYIYATVFEPRTKVGVVALDPVDYDPSAWWKRSAGFRTIVNELLEYGYTRMTL